MTQKIVVFGTGGTIACTRNEQKDLVPTLSARDLISRAGFADDAQIVTKDILQLDSSSITLADIDYILGQVAAAQHAGAAGVVVLHGTDSMEETAMAAALLSARTTPIVFTGAQRPADDDSPDGPANIAGAIDTARHNTGRVMIHFGGRTIDAYGATKWHTTDADAFRNMIGEEPPIGDRPATLLQLDGTTVDIVFAYGGADGNSIDRNADGLVIAAMGSGNIPSTMMPAVDSFEGPIVVCSRVPEGDVHFIYGGAGGGAELARQGIRGAGALSPAQARIELLCRLVS